MVPQKADLQDPLKRGRPFAFHRNAITTPDVFAAAATMKSPMNVKYL